jgi:hypothetical protein
MMPFIYFFNQIKNKQIPKCCVKCNYYYVPKNTKEKSIFAIAKCMKFVSLSRNGRPPEFEYAIVARSGKTLCGPEGNHFEPLKK